MDNLDIACAKLGADLGAQSDDKTITDALWVLEEQGVYAFFLFLDQKSERRRIIDACRKFLQKRFPDGFGSGNDVFKATQALARSVDQLLLARDLLRQSLLYARYHAKASASGRER